MMAMRHKYADKKSWDVIVNLVVGGGDTGFSVSGKGKQMQCGEMVGRRSQLLWGDSDDE